MQIKNRQQLLVIGAVAAIALFAGDRLVLSPLLTKAWNARAKRIADLRKQIAQGKMLLQREQSIRSRWQQMSPQHAAEQHLRRRTAGLQGH